MPGCASTPFAPHIVALALVLTACRPPSNIPDLPRSAEAPQAAAPGLRATSTIEAPLELIVADRGIEYVPDGVTVRARWRAEDDPRGVVVMIPPEAFDASDLAGVANSFLDAHFNVALVEPYPLVSRPLRPGVVQMWVDTRNGPIPLATRVAEAAGIANDKSLNRRQIVEDERPPRPTIIVLWIDDRHSGTAVDVLRAAPSGSFVQAAIVITPPGVQRRQALREGRWDQTEVLEYPVPLGGRFGAAASRDWLRFLEEVERELFGARLDESASGRGAELAIPMAPPARPR